MASASALAILLPVLAGCTTLAQGGACVVAERHTSEQELKAEFQSTQEVQVTVRLPPGNNMTLCVW
jgi:hypothetical protein